MASTEQSTGAAVFSSLGVIVNFFVFASEAPLMRRLYKEKDASKYSYWSSWTLLLATVLWSNYTVYVRPTVQLYLANFSGAFAAIIYLSFYAVFSQPKSRKQIILLGTGTLAGCCIFYAIAFAALDFPAAEGLCGTTTVLINCLFFIAPLKQLRIAVKDLDISRVPVTLSVTQFIGASTWTTAGILLKDNFITAPNSFGVVIASVQLGVIAYVWWRRRNHADAFSNPHKQLDEETSGDVKVAVQPPQTDPCATMSSDSTIEMSPVKQVE